MQPRVVDGTTNQNCAPTEENPVGPGFCIMSNAQ